MNVLITGASGYIGRKLVMELSRLGHSITVITRNPSKLKCLNAIFSTITVDLISDSLVELDLRAYDIIYNCAGELRNESMMHKLHIDASMRLLSKISDNTTRWVQLSSVGVYGQNVSGKVTESFNFAPIGQYEVTKAEAEIKIREYCMDNGIPFSILRPSNVFSVDMPNNSLRQFVRFIKRGLFFYMKDPEEVMVNYVHVDDVVNALILCGFSKNAINNDYIISDNLNQKEFVNIVCTSLNKENPRIFIPYAVVKCLSRIFAYIPYLRSLDSKVNALSTTVLYSTGKIEKELGYKKQRPLGEAIVEFSLLVDKNV